MDEIKPFFKKRRQIIRASNQLIKHHYLKWANFTDSLPDSGHGAVNAANQNRCYSSGAYLKLREKPLLYKMARGGEIAWEWLDNDVSCVAAA
jgi:hypothetical protein